jgi:hypothetical protein
VAASTDSNDKNMTSLMPNSIWGWLGIVALLMAVFSKMFGMVGRLILLAVALWLYFVKDNMAAPATSV